MGYRLFSVGEHVRVTAGAFKGIEGTVVPPADNAGTAGTVLLQAEGELLPVTISTILDGHSLTLRVPPERLERVE